MWINELAAIWADGQKLCQGSSGRGRRRRHFQAYVHWQQAFYVLFLSAYTYVLTYVMYNTSYKIRAHFYEHSQSFMLRKCFTSSQDSSNFLTKHSKYRSFVIKNFEHRDLYSTITIKHNSFFFMKKKRMSKRFSAPFETLCREYVPQSRFSAYLWPTFRLGERLALLLMKIEENCFPSRFTSLMFPDLTIFLLTQLCR